LVAGSIRASHAPGRGVIAPQHSTHTPSGVSAGDAVMSSMATVATTRLATGSIRASPCPHSEAHSAPAPTRMPSTEQPSGRGRMPATLATTRLVRGSTREIAQPWATHTASGPTATRSTGCRNRILAITGEGAVEVG
jgi:hypothetical protein